MCLLPLAFVSLVLLLMKSCMYTDKEERYTFMVSQSTSTHSLPHTVVREKIFESVMTLYRIEMDINEYPFSIAFEEETAIDLGGVSRDVYRFL